MNHTIKMKLVPVNTKHIQEPVHPVVNKLNDLNNDMEQILRHPTQSLEEQLRSYQHILQRYRTFYDQYQRRQPGLAAAAAPDTAAVTDTAGLSPPPQKTEVSPPQPAAAKKAVETEVVQSLPNNLRSKGKKLLKRLNSNTLTYNPNDGGLIHRGNPVPGTHILDLVHDAVRSQKNSNRAPPRGWEVFAQGLKDINIPSEYISDRYLGKSWENWKH